MPSDVTAGTSQGTCVDSAGLAAAIAATDFSDCAATVIGYGAMGKQYVKALRALGLRRIRVCSRSPEPMEELRVMDGLEIVAGGFERLVCHPQPGELGIVATPTLRLMDPAERLASLGFRRLLIEKPVSLSSSQIQRFAQRLEQQGVEASCAYNRVAYPSFHEVKSRAFREGGITSCRYTFTEMIKPDWPQRFPAEELARWGISNSLHPISMAHGLIGWPATWQGSRRGSLSWHPTGAVFVGSGISEEEVPFSYHADWGSMGRWSVEVHTAAASYQLCPLERLFRKSSAIGDWEEVPVMTFASEVKAGLVEQAASMLRPEIRSLVPPVSLEEAAALTRYGEQLFGYA